MKKILHTQNRTKLFMLILLMSISINKIFAQLFTGQVTGVQQIINGAINPPTLNGMNASFSYFNPPGGVPKFMNLYARVPSSTNSAWVVMNVYLDTFPQTRQLNVGFTLQQLGIPDNVRVQSLMLAAEFTNQPVLSPNTSPNYNSYTCPLDSLLQIDSYDGNPAGSGGPQHIPSDYLGNVLPSVTRGCDVGNVDLDGKNHPAKGTYAGDVNACGPAAVANSLGWIESKNPNIGADGLTERQRLEELSALMGRLAGMGVTFDQIIQAKISFISNHKLKLRVEYHHASGNYQDDLKWLQDEYNAGQDIEFDYSYLDKDGNVRSHIVVITGLTVTGNVPQITFKDDKDQKKAGGTEETPVTVSEDANGHMSFTRFGRTCTINNMYAESYDNTAGDYTDPKTGTTSTVFCVSVKKRCAGACPALVSFFSATKQPLVAHPECNATSCCDINTLIIDGPCAVNKGNCKGTCPPIYRSLKDATLGRNPIGGKCDAANACKCKYDVSGRYYRESRPQEILNSDQLSLYPNPATQEINIGVGDFEGKTEIILINMLGQKIISTTINLHGEDVYSIDISNLSRGIYKVVLMNDGDVSSGTFVKE